MKNKSNGTFRAHMNIRGYKQVYGQHHDATLIHAPVTNDSIIRISMIIAIMADCYGQIVNVKGKFLHERLDSEKERMHLKVPEGLKITILMMCCFLCKKTFMEQIKQK